MVQILAYQRHVAVQFLCAKHHLQGVGGALRPQ
jgi:hypothetical protein